MGLRCRQLMARSGISSRFLISITGNYRGRHVKSLTHPPSTPRQSPIHQISGKHFGHSSIPGLSSSKLSFLEWANKPYHRMAAMLRPNLEVTTFQCAWGSTHANGARPTTFAWGLRPAGGNHPEKRFTHTRPVWD